MSQAGSLHGQAASQHLFWGLRGMRRGVFSLFAGGHGASRVFQGVISPPKGPLCFFGRFLGLGRFRGLFQALFRHLTLAPDG